MENLQQKITMVSTTFQREAQNITNLKEDVQKVITVTCTHTATAATHTHTHYNARIQYNTHTHYSIHTL